MAFRDSAHFSLARIDLSGALASRTCPLEVWCCDVFGVPAFISVFLRQSGGLTKLESWGRQAPRLHHKAPEIHPFDTYGFSRRG